jgi:hypothetical protein
MLSPYGAARLAFEAKASVLMASSLTSVFIGFLKFIVGDISLDSVSLGAIAQPRAKWLDAPFLTTPNSLT